jgi:RNA polymerase sigma-70 factor, ECF subfamily
MQLQGMLLDGSTSSFQILYERFSDALYGILFRIVHDEEQAADLLQDAFLKIWQQAQKYDATKGTVFTWMLNVTRNLALDKLRSAEFSKKKQTFSLEDNVNTYERSSSNDHAERAADVVEMVSRLQPQHKQLIEMVYIQGYTQAEVADILAIPLGTVKTRIRSALQYLRSQVI